MRGTRHVVAAAFLVAIAVAGVPGVALSLTAEEVFRVAAPSVVSLQFRTTDGFTQGSGFLVAPGVIATNWHVVEGGSDGVAKLAGYDRLYTVLEVLVADPERDLALLAVELTGAPALRLGDSDAVVIGEPVFAVGSPEGFEATISLGILSGIRREDGLRYLQITAAISHGSSGGPIFNESGAVIGVAVAVIEGAQNLNFAVPSSDLAALMSRLPIENRASPASPRVNTHAPAPGLPAVPPSPPLEDGLAQSPPGPAADRYEDGMAAHDRGDYETALTLWRPLAEQGHAGAQFDLGVMFANGLGVPENDVEAVRWYRLAAEQGNAAAQLNLGVMYADGRGVPQSYTEAVRLYRLGAEQGYGFAQNNLGAMYRHGTGVRQNYPEAVRWFRLAAEQGGASAQYNLGVMFSFGEGVPQNDAEAARWYRLAAEQVHADAQLNLGAKYADGSGGPQSYVLSHMWLNLAASRQTSPEGRERAVENRDIIGARMTREQIAEAQRLAAEWQQK